MEGRILLLIFYDAKQCAPMLKKLDEKTIRFHLRKSFVTFAKRIRKDNGTFRRRMRILGAIKSLFQANEIV